MPSLSLSARLTLVAAAVLLGFFGLTGVVLNGAFQQSIEEGIRENLQGQVYLLMAAAELGDDGELRMPTVLPEPRFSSPISGLCASVTDAGGETLWRSESCLGTQVSFPMARLAGEAVFVVVSAPREDQYFAMSYIVIWELAGGGERALIFQVGQTSRHTDAQIDAFRHTLRAWLFAAAAVLLIAQALALRWGLAPLRRVAREVSDVEQGTRSQLGDGYPKELLHLTRNLNALLTSSETRLQRYRDALADLAHALKTPLAVLSTIAKDDVSNTQSDSVMEQVDRMNQAIGYHLQRGAAAGRSGLSTTVHPAAVLARIVRSLAKVYAQKRVVVDMELDEGAVFVGDEGDLTEILGNLLDNAHKWCHRRIRVRVKTATDRREALLIEIEDDGPGVPRAVRRRVLNRGVRADQLVPGQGIGLAVVREMVDDIYQGSLELADSDLGGARIRLIL